jgi:hypothetical protein
MDPSFQLWLEGATIDARADQGTALRMDGFVVYHHNFVQGTTLRFQMHSTSVFTGATDVDVSVDVGAWMGRWAPHVFFNIKAAVPVEANRTRRYLRFTNTDANTAPIQIGELLPLGVVQSTTNGVLMALTKATNFGRSFATGKKGPVYIHDRRTRNRQWTGTLLPHSGDPVFHEAWHDDSYGVRPFVCWPENDLTREPVLARFMNPDYSRTYVTHDIEDTVFQIEELSCGEAY